ncbi:TadE/TadG family type IV pilus assembly protein [Novosphingobium sp. ZN18A2]|uniref:TadE/TadG family type IV pilus assembly protein n=1 Tax=Novosphingobium sp. ZN18A2 TaxID=3079861 RepID=UPI0030CCBDD9
MTRTIPFLKRLARNQSGSTLVEFALIGPAFLAMLFGVFQVAVLIQNYNALRSVGDDLSRYVVVQHQKGAPVSQSDIQDTAVSIAASKPYYLDTAFLSVNSTTGTSAITGADKVTLDLEYKSADFLQFFDVNGITLSFHKDLYVPSA